MKKFLIALSFLGLSTLPSFAQQNPMMPMRCAPTSLMVTNLKKLNQSLVFYGQNDSNLVMLFMNPEKKDWFFIISPLQHPELSCIVQDGEQSDNVFPIKPSEDL